MDLLGTIPEAWRRRLGINALSNLNPEVVVGLRTLKSKVIFVNSGAAAGGNGASWDGAVLTINAAVALADANDVILVAPGHAETLSAAAGIALTKAGLYVLGLGAGAKRPTITMGTIATVDIDIDAADCTIENFLFVANVAAIAAAIDVNADDFTLRSCEFREAGADLNFLVCVIDGSGTTSDRITIEGCRAKCADTDNTHFINFTGTGDGHMIRNNILFGDWGTMCIGGAGVVTNTMVLNNIIYNVATTTDGCINFASTATGFIFSNHATGGAAQANGFTAAAMGKSNNFYGVNAEDLSALLDPILT